MTRPARRAQLRNLIYRWAAGDRIPGDRALVLVASTAVVAALDGLRDGNGKPRLVIKGGAALKLRVGGDVRLTKDLDASFRGELHDAEVLVRSALAKGWNGFTATLSDPQELTETSVTPPPQRYQLTVSYEGQSLTRFPFEIALAEAGSADDPEVLIPAVTLEAFGFPDLEPVAFLPARYQIAQKLHACTEVFDEGVNRRARDLLDILIIEELIGIDDWPALRAACEETFAVRNKQPWPPKITVYPVWEHQWPTLTLEARRFPTLNQAVDRVEAIIIKAAKA